MKVRVPAIADEFCELAVGDQRPVERVILDENLMRRLLVVECEIIAGISEPEQSAFDFGHPAHAVARGGAATSRRSVEIAEQMFYVIDQQFLMLHLVLEPQPDKQKKVVGVGNILRPGEQLEHRLI